MLPGGRVRRVDVRCRLVECERGLESITGGWIMPCFCSNRLAWTVLCCLDFVIIEGQVFSNYFKQY